MYRKEWPNFFDESPEPFDMAKFSFELQRFLKYEANNMENLEQTKLTENDIEEHTFWLMFTANDYGRTKGDKIIHNQLKERFIITFGDYDD